VERWQEGKEMLEAGGKSYSESKVFLVMR
jgi:hypothetical protein